MKSCLLSLFIIVLVCFSCKPPTKPVATMDSSNDNKIIFGNDDFDKALADSKSQNKPIFLDVYTSWCGWCKQLDNTTYKDPSVIRYINKNFIPLKINAEYAKGPEIAKRYAVDSYPRMMFLDSTGKSLLTLIGYCDAPNLLKSANQVSRVYNKH